MAFVFTPALQHGILEGVPFDSAPFERALWQILAVSLQHQVDRSRDEQFVDDVSGQLLDTEMVKEAWKEEMEQFDLHKVYAKVPISECVRMTSKGPIGSRWIDINKGDIVHPNYRSRLVAKEIKSEHADEMFAATPPLEAKKCLFAMAMTIFAL